MQSHNKIGTTLNLLVILLCLALCPLSFALTPENKITDQVVSRMYEYMNVTINPCENFYEYSCGNWLKSHSHIINDPVNNLDKIYNNKLKNLLDVENEYENIDTILMRSRIYYKSCKQTEIFDVASYLNVLKPMDNEVWPQSGKLWKPKNKWNMWLTLGKLAGIGFKDLFFHVTWGKDNLTSYQLTLKACNYQNLGEVRGKGSTNIQEDVKAFLQQLNALCENNHTSDVQHMTVAELQQQVATIDFLSYFSGLFGDIPLPLSSISINVENLPYYRDLADLVKKSSQDTLIHTMKYLLELYLEDNLPNDCITHMRKVLPLALNYIYEKYEYQQQKRATDEIVYKIFKNLQNKFLEILKKDSNEFSAAERRFLNEKLLKMKLNIGNLQLDVDDDFYMNYYHDWVTEQDRFFVNHLNLWRHKMLEDLGTTSFVYNFSSTFENVLQAFYPFYLFPKNVLVMPFQYLSYPEFQPQLHELLQYSDLGYSMAHAMMYGFSEYGLQYNAAGIRNISFAQSLLQKAILRKAVECLNASKPYEVDIKMTDFIGFRLAYDTYFQKPAVRELKTNTNLTNKQLFYLGFAQSECIVRRLPTYVELPLAIQNIVENSREFEEVFGCLADKGDVQPRMKCEIW